MARKLKTYETSLGFFDQAIAAPSMKAALEAWGADSNLFHQGAAKESDDPDVIAATMAKPVAEDRRKPPANRKLPNRKGLHRGPADKAAEQKAALAYERERKRRDGERESSPISLLRRLLLQSRPMQAFALCPFRFLLYVAHEICHRKHSAHDGMKMSRKNYVASDLSIIFEFWEILKPQVVDDRISCNQSYCAYHQSFVRIGHICPVCTENLIRVDAVMESPKLAE